MGTNYYAKPAPHVEIHLGKQSAGWPFLFHAQPGWTEAKAKEEWIDLASSYPLQDEYERPITFDQLMEKIRASYEASDRRHTGAFFSSGYQFVRGEFC